MTERERFLSIFVGGLLAVALVWWGFGKYNTAVKSRTNQIAELQQQQQKLNEQRLQGEYANRQMGEYLIRSLPGDPEQAQSQYQQWLLDMVQENNFPMHWLTQIVRGRLEAFINYLIFVFGETRMCPT